MGFRSVFIVIVVIGLFPSCKSPSIMQKTILAEIPVQNFSKSIVLIDAGQINTPGLAITKKREEVVSDITRNYLLSLPAILEKDLQMKVFTDSTLTEQEKALLLQNDNYIRSKIMERYDANIIIIFQSYKGGFNQDYVDRLNYKGGYVDKQAQYSVFFHTTLAIIQGNQMYVKYINANKYHSQRQVRSGLLARGPGYAANKKDIAAMAHRNASYVSGLFRDRKGTMNTRGQFIEMDHGQ